METTGKAELVLDATMDAGRDALFLVDEHGRCTWANSAGAELLRIEPSALARSAFWELIEQRLDGATRASWRETVSKRAPADLGEYRSPAGRCFACRSFPVGRGALLYLVDVTAKEAALQAAREERRRIEHFLAVLAHELRNPLSTLVNGVTLLQTRTTEIDRARLVQVLRRQLRHFVDVVDDLFDVSALALGQMRIKLAPVEIDALVVHAVSAVADLVKTRRHRLEVGPTCGAIVEGDFTRLAQAIINLLKNAAAYTTPGGSIFIDARVFDGQVEISVADTGRGISPARLPHIFDRVYELERKGSNDSTGLGIGLGVVRRIAELHGGSVVAYSRGRDCGSEFKLRLPSSAQAPSTREERLGRGQGQQAPVADAADVMHGLSAGLRRPALKSRAPTPLPESPASSASA